MIEAVPSSPVCRTLRPTVVNSGRTFSNAARLPPAKNIFLYYAIGKELEDLGNWDEAFEFYERGGAAAAEGARAAGYEVGTDIALIDRIIEACDSGWLADGVT